MSEHTKDEFFDVLMKMGPYRKEPTEIVVGIQWYKIVDKNGVPLVNYDMAEDKADFICLCVNSHDDLFVACERYIAYREGGDDDIVKIAMLMKVAIAKSEVQAVAATDEIGDN